MSTLGVTMSAAASAAYVYTVGERVAHWLGDLGSVTQDDGHTCVRVQWDTDASGDAPDYVKRHNLRPLAATPAVCDHRWEPNGTWDLRCHDCGEETSSLPALPAPKCDCGGWTCGTHSDWCSAPNDNLPREKGLVRK